MMLSVPVKRVTDCSTEVRVKADQSGARQDFDDPLRWNRC